MFLRLLLLFTAVPLVELALLLEIGQRVGLPATLALVLGTGVLGAWLAKREGLRTLTRVREEMAAGKLPADALLDGLLILIAGAVLLTPGLLTDLFGFVLLIPGSRRAIRRRVAARLRRSLERGNARVIVIDDRPRSE
jgi:UPF0716 protein FxsA